MQFNEQNIIRTIRCSTLNMGSVLSTHNSEVLLKTTKTLPQMSNAPNEAEDLKLPSGNTLKQTKWSVKEQEETSKAGHH